MVRTPEEEASTARFGAQYELAQSPPMLAVERVVCGCDYGGTSWATRAEAERLGPLLGLAAGRRLLDVGAGSGWPALFVARETGCDVTLVDVPLAGIRIAARRASADALSGTCWAAVADGAALPFADASFDAVSHSDVLCCLEAKHAVLRECRRVMRAEGTMVFTVIAIAPRLSSSDRERAAERGPPFVSAPSDYAVMLQETGWAVAERIDLTRQYADTVRRLARELSARAEELIALLGAGELEDLLSRKQAALEGIEEGLLVRELFVARPAAV